MTHALLIGKFWPLHRGHQLMIDTAYAIFDEVTIIVSNKSEKHMIQSETALYAEYGHKSNIVAYLDIIEIGETDKFGTCHDDAFWDAWVKVFKDIAPSATHFVSSDRYGELAASKLGIEWFPVDPDREVYNISATEIRGSLDENFEWLSPFMKEKLTLSVAVVGPESTGKSTLARYLSDTWDGVYVPEWGRVISEAKRNALTSEDFDHIVIMQNLLIKKAKAIANGLVITDSENFTTYLYAKEYLNENNMSILREANKQKFDLVLILAPTVPYTDDGTRVMPSLIKREEFFEDLVAFFKENGFNYKIIDETDWQERISRAADYIDEAGFDLYKQYLQ